ncbi:hypothetical protein FJV76_26025 [Mesorhizobium sp. WSM4303]|uniref:hypothetical protein n=1 Tax=unclassified Mesorhizobium TaxID=325217 RepID=UPI00115D1517|nr:MULTISPECIES: hypothetical protein [unclassified Mesorhizobium]TRC96098.1 hypothetical protein FJV77_14480 [Mesorhizobium sp. WSM4306]TRC98192.1 hypothetical protein FJV76_26025 [Mesorhizobium sp. WSM4303]
MRRKASLVAVAGFNALALALDVQGTQAAVSSQEESPIHRLHEIRRAYIESIEQKGWAIQGDVETAQYWGNFPNFPNWANWNNWLNGWRNF